MVAEIARLFRADGGLDRTYCDTMSWAAAHYLSRRYGNRPASQAVRHWKLPAWRLRRIADYVDAHIDSGIRVADLARLIGVSAGHLHRAFRATTGKTPLAFITERRVQQAMQMLSRESAPVAEIALRVGFLNPSHFTRVFRRVAGCNPAEYRSGACSAKPGTRH